MSKFRLTLCYKQNSLLQSYHFLQNCNFIAYTKRTYIVLHSQKDEEESAGMNAFESMPEIESECSRLFNKLCTITAHLFPCHPSIKVFADILDLSTLNTYQMNSSSILLYHRMRWIFTKMIMIYWQVMHLTYQSNKSTRENGGKKGKIMFINSKHDEMNICIQII